MVLRLLQVHTTRDGAERVRPLFEEMDSAWWQEVQRGEQGSQFAALVEVGREQKLLDELDLACATDTGARILVLPVEATLPKLEPQEPLDEGDKDASSATGRLSREELHDDITAACQLSWNYVAMLVLSVGVVAIGLWRDSAAVVIGGMVLAPLLGPNIALGFAATLADGKLALQALRTGAVGFVVALLLSLGVGLAFGLPFDAEGLLASSEIRSRTLPHVLDLLLAFAAGVAGAMSFTTAVSTSLVGVMVAVALMPPLVVLGMCLGAGRWDDAEGAATLLATNIVCVDLAAVLTFVAQAVRPRDWWQVKLRQRVVRLVIVVLLVALVAVSVQLAFHRAAH
jgi:uncharacterized hydrophobic protein (TIGR00341 family)